MSTLERRLQLLIDHERYARLAAEAERSGRSVNAVIRHAIDVQYPPGVESRSAALLEFLEMTSTPEPGEAESWDDIKAGLEDRYTSSW